MRGMRSPSAPRSRRPTRPRPRPRGDLRTSRCSASSISAPPTGSTLTASSASSRGARGRPLTYALVDLPTNPWAVAAEHCAPPSERGGPRHPRPGENGPGSPMSAPDLTTPRRRPMPTAVAERSTAARRRHRSSAWRASRWSRRPACRRAPSTSRSPERRCTGCRGGGPGLERVGLPRLSGPPRRGRASRMASGGRAAMAEAARAARRGTRAGREVHRRAPGVPGPVSRSDGALRGAHRGHERAARRVAPGGTDRPATVAAVVVPVWMRTLEEIRAPFAAGDGQIDGLELESAELFRLDNPYWHDDPAVFARGYVQSVTAWGGPLLLRAFAREGEAAPGLVADFLARARRARGGGARPLPPGLHRGPRHLPEGGRQRAPHGAST